MDTSQRLRIFHSGSLDDQLIVQTVEGIYVVPFEPGGWAQRRKYRRFEDRFEETDEETLQVIWDLLLSDPDTVPDTVLAH